MKKKFPFRTDFIRCCVSKKMKRINKIINHPLYRESLEKIENYEKEREFCKHDRKHFLDVCRIAYLFYLEEEQLQKSLPYEKEQIKELLYGAGLLHDIGRWQQYEQGIEHHIASAVLARTILQDTDFSKEEEEIICEVILSHRSQEESGKKTLAGIFYRADKASRACYWCPMEDKCNWKNEKKNVRIWV